MKFFQHIYSATFLFLFPLIAAAQTLPFTATSSKFADLVKGIIRFINTLTPILASLAVVFFFYGLVRYIYEVGAKGHTKGREAIIWGLVAMFVIFSISGILLLLQYTLFPGSPAFVPGTPILPHPSL